MCPNLCCLSLKTCPLSQTDCVFRCLWGHRGLGIHRLVLLLYRKGGGLFTPGKCPYILPRGAGLFWDGPRSICTLTVTLLLEHSWPPPSPAIAWKAVNWAHWAPIPYCGLFSEWALEAEPSLKGQRGGCAAARYCRGITGCTEEWDTCLSRGINLSEAFEGSAALFLHH